MMSLEQLTSIGRKFDCIPCPLIFQGGDEHEKWKLIITLQNSLGEIECLMYLNILSVNIHYASHTTATIEDRLQALYEISIL